MVGGNLSLQLAFFLSLLVQDSFDLFNYFFEKCRLHSLLGSFYDAYKYKKCSLSLPAFQAACILFYFLKK